MGPMETFLAVWLLPQNSGPSAPRSVLNVKFRCAKPSASLAGLVFNKVSDTGNKQPASLTLCRLAGRSQIPPGELFIKVRTLEYKETRS